MAKCMNWLHKLTRRKVFKEEDLHKTDLRRCLTTLDLIGLGMSSTLGSSLYILTGQVARYNAGPAVIFSFVIAGLAAGLGGFCYAEFAARVPRAGSAYLYSYVTVGELMAFIIGWNIMLEYVISVSGLARAMSVYIDFATGNSMQKAFRAYMPIDIPGLSPYPDFFAFGLVLVATGVVAVGVKDTTRVSTALNSVNIVALLLIIVIGIKKTDIANWKLGPDQIPSSAGTGGFAPFGFSGIMTGAGTCFFAFIGFDFLASMGEETENPRRAIPLSMCTVILIVIAFHVVMGSIVCLMCPYYLLDEDAPLAFAFKYVGWTKFADYVVTVGACFAIASSCLSSLLPMTRVLYSMASDGLISRCLAKVSPRFGTPLLGTIVTGLFAGVMAIFFTMIDLIHMLSIGTLLAFGLVSLCVLILRYRPDPNSAHQTGRSGQVGRTPAETGQSWLCFVKRRSGPPTSRTCFLANCCISVMYSLIVLLCVLVNVTYTQLMNGDIWCVVLTVVVATGLVVFCFLLGRLPQNTEKLHYKMPCVPLVPTLSGFVNVSLMFKLTNETWIRFGVWMVLGFFIYFGYGIKHSTLNEPKEEQRRLCPSPEGHYHYTTACPPVPEEDEADNTV